MTTQKRKAGVLMPVSSLPSGEGIGTLGKSAYEFIDWLENSNMKVWQVLPLLPTGYGDSPYQSYASNALNYYFIDLDTLANAGLLEESEYKNIPWSEDIRRVGYGELFNHKAEILKKAFARFDKTTPDWQAFLEKGEYRDFAVFMTLKGKFSYKPWREWDEPYKSCDKQAIDEILKTEKESVEFWQFTQYIFLRQWWKLRDYAKEKGVEIMGDMPIYVADDSVECWMQKSELFMVDEEGELALKAGVPPDAFSKDGQFWGNPVYDWEKMKKDGYSWWKNRISYALKLFDIVRIDHFRAFDRFYAIPAGAETAKEGEWLDGPKKELFKDFKTGIVAEDLGTIDEGVRQLLEDTNYPNMKIFEFAFDGDEENEYLPVYYGENCVAYTGTHDNQTLRSFIEDMPKKTRKAFEEELENQCLEMDVFYVTETIEEECKTVVELLFASKANTVIIPMHDLCCFDDEARLNAPSTLSGSNWTFRFKESDFKNRTSAWLKELTETYQR